MLTEAERDAVSGKHKGDALSAFARAYRSFAKKHEQLYRFIMQIPKEDNKVLAAAASVLAEPIMEILEDYDLEETERLHWQRVIRASIHGFISQESAGYFSHYPADLEGSFSTLVRCLDSGLSAAEKRSDAS